MIKNFIAERNRREKKIPYTLNQIDIFCPKIICIIKQQKLKKKHIKQQNNRCALLKFKFDVT